LHHRGEKKLNGELCWFGDFFRPVRHPEASPDSLTDSVMIRVAFFASTTSTGFVEEVFVSVIMADAVMVASAVIDTDLA